MRHLGTWIAIRTILVANVALLVVVGFIALLFVSPPAAIFVAAAIWLAAGVLIGLVPLTDPYRAEERRRRRYAAAHTDE